MAVKAIYVELMEQAACSCKLAKMEEKVAELEAELSAAKTKLAECQAGGEVDSTADTSELENRISQLQSEVERLTSELASAQQRLAECEAQNQLPPFEVTSRGNYNTLTVEGDVIRNSEGHISFEFSANMEIYKLLGYKVYGVVKTETGAVILEEEFDEVTRKITLSSYSASELPASLLSKLIGKQVANPALLKFGVYLRKDHIYIYPTNGDIPTQAVVENRD